MKFFQKKEITLEKTPILFRLERRHTLLDGIQDEEIVGEPKRAFRANSVGSYTRTPTSTKPEAAISKLCLSDGGRSNYSAASTVVITESELSSSWLYNTRKAKIDSDGEPSTNSTEQPEDNAIQPVEIRDPEMKPVPVPLKKRPEKKSSCCCYVLVAITICLASLGIMAAIGGIIYLEVFAVYRNMLEGKHPHMKHDEKMVGKSEMTTVHPNEGWSLNGFKNLVDDHAQDNINDRAEINEDNSNKEDNPFSDQQDGEDMDTLKVKLRENPNVASDISDQINKSTLNENSLHHDNDVIEDLLDVDGTNHDISEHEYEENFDIDDSKLKGNEHVMNEPSSNQVNLDNASEDNQEHESQDENKDQSFKLDSLESILRHQANSRLPRMEPDSFEDGNPDVTNNDYIEYQNILGMEPQNQDDFDDSELDYDMVMNQPIVEAKPPIDFQTRLINSFNNKGTDKPLTAEEMEMKFTLSEILKYLRNLDANNQLPSTRQSQKSTAATISMSTIDIGSERKEYLDNLRRRLYT